MENISEDIKILEEFKTKGYSMLLIKYGDRNKTNLKLEKAIENLIKGYRELEIFEQQVINHQNSNVFKCKNYIPKSKIKEKIEELNKKYKGIESNYTEEELDSGDEGLDDYIEMQKIQMADNILQELLEEE